MRLVIADPDELESYIEGRIEYWERIAELGRKKANARGRVEGLREALQAVRGLRENGSWGSLEPGG